MDARNSNEGNTGSSDAAGRFIRRLAYAGVIAISIFLLTFVGCGIDASRDTGLLILSLSELLTVRTIEPTLDMNIVYYDIHGSGPGDTEFEQLGVSGSTVVQASLVPGEWTVTVEAYNGDTPSTLIGMGEITVLIVAGAVLNESIIVRPITGTGTLTVDVSWPAGVLSSPSLVSMLVPLGETPDPGLHEVAFPVSGETASFSGESLGAGYYTLSITLLDGGVPVWGTVEAVRIISGEVSAKIYELVEAVNRGGLELSVVEELENSIGVSFDLADGVQVEAGHTLIVTARVSEAVDSYHWYLQGLPQSETDNVIAFTPSQPGYYQLDLVVFSGTVAGSAHLQFQVVAASGAASATDPWWVYAVAYVEPDADGGTPPQMNGQTLTSSPDRPSAYYGTVDTVAPGDDLILTVSHAGVLLTETVVMPGRPVITSQGPISTISVYSEVLQTDIIVENTSVTWTVESPVPSFFDVGFALSIDHSGPSSGGYGTGGIIPNLASTVRESDVAPSADEFEFLTTMVWEGIQQDRLTEYSFSAMTLSQLSVTARTVAEMGGPAGELPSMMQVANISVH